MNKNVRFLTAAALLSLLFSLQLTAQNASDIVVPVTVTTSASPKSITLSFPATANAVSTLIGKKLINQISWNYAVLPAGVTSVTDTAIQLGVGYEYIVIKQTSTAPTTRYGLVYAGIQLPAAVYRGKMILVVDNTLTKPLTSELDRFVQDLRGDGWQVLRHDIDVASSTVQSVKSLLRTDYNADPNNTSAALLFGNIPVPYSGNINPDGHGEHLGAWPTDYYYSDMDEAPWTDNTVNNNAAARAANRNIPGDGKFDPSQTPTLPELVVSRVDFSNLNNWPVSQTELYRRYLDKNHAFRTGAYRPANNTLIDDNFGFFGGEAFAQSGWANAHALTGANSAVAADFFNNTDNQSFLVGYGCGSGNYTGAQGVGTSDNFKTDSVNIVFSMLFGSYHGDWDYEDNPFMPSALASKGSILNCTWAGRPNWFFHHMGLGEPIMTSTYWTWLNSFLSNPVYPPNSGYDLIHVGLLGDPTLRAHAVRPPTNVVATANCNHVGLSWTASTDPALAYVIYRASSVDSIFQVLDFAAGTGYIDSFPLPGQNFYQVKALALQNTPTGSYFNQSLGIPASANFNPTPPTAVASATPVSCNGAANGAINLNVTGGMSFVYLWSNGMNTPNLSGLAPGTYTVTVTNPQLCTATASATVTEPPALTVAVSVNNISCFGLNNGSVGLTPGGGTPPYQFAWSTGSAAEDISNLGPGAYTVTMTDTEGCTATASMTITQPSDLTVEITAVDASCNGASDGGVNLTTGGGTPGYTYSWSNGAATSFLANVVAGAYTVTTTDNKGCTETASATINEPPAIIIETTISNAGCAGATNGGVTLAVSSGVPGYNFLWSNGTTDRDLTNVAAGTYTVTVTDAAGCTRTTSATVQQITTLALETAADNATCFGSASGSATAMASGGAPDYTFLWSNGEKTEQIGNLGAGTYTVTVTDAAGCTQTANATVGQPPVLSAGAVWNANPCVPTSGTVTLTVSGGTPGYSFLWSTGATTQNLTNTAPGIYTVTITDTQGCSITRTNTVVQPPAALSAAAIFLQTGCTDAVPLIGNVISEVNGGTPPYSYKWSNGGVTKDLTGVPSETYTVTVTDQNGCTAVNATFTFQLLLPWNLSTTVTNALCFNDNSGQVALSVSGAAGPPYTYKWSNGSTNPGLSNLFAGTYTVTVTDVDGCTTTSSAVVSQPTALAASFSNVKNVSCPGVSDGQAAVNASNGTPPYTYAWSNGATTPAVTNLSAGITVCTITDANGCTRILNAIINAPPPSGAAISGLDSACLDLPVQYTLAPNFTNYQWLASNNGLITQGQGTNAATVLWAIAGANTLTAYFTNASNCPDTAVLNLTVNICVGTSAPTLPGVRVMPNPFADHLSIVFDRPVQPNTRLRLTDLQGRLIAENFPVNDQTRLETLQLPAGAYLLHIVENGRVGVWKVVKTGN